MRVWGCTFATRTTGIPEVSAYFFSSLRRGSVEACVFKRLRLLCPMLCFFATRPTTDRISGIGQTKYRQQDNPLPCFVFAFISYNMKICTYTFTFRIFKNTTNNDTIVFRSYAYLDATWHKSAIISLFKICVRFIICSFFQWKACLETFGISITYTSIAMKWNNTRLLPQQSVQPHPKTKIPTC